MDPLKNKWLTVALCSYEIIAILAGKDKLPTITQLTLRHRWLGVVLTAAMGRHFAVARQEAVR